MPEAVIFCGIQASGKTQFYKRVFLDTHVRISLDLLKTRHRERALLVTCLQTTQSFVVDNTNATKEERARYIAPARSGGFEVVGYLFETTPRAAIGRNSRRVGKQQIPVGGLLGTFKRLQRPSPSEGFDRLYRVRIDPEGAFLVDELGDQPAR